MNTAYNPHEIEPEIYKFWEDKNYFAPHDTQKNYCVMLPPPNVTGHLHMGHSFQHTLMDILIRYHRMQGDSTLWQVGTDHAGIATQMVVERQLQAQNQTRHELGREKFIEKIWEWKEKSGDAILKQMRKLGASADWSRACFTMDEKLSHAVKTAFIKLYNDELIYRGKKLVNWDPVFLTAISDLEVMNTEEKGSLWYFRYPLADNPSSYITIATTRPETMLGDTAVAVHPEDSRYQHLINQFILLPIANRKIKIIADASIDPSFGTGCVKITPAHDFNDYEIGKKHNLEIINIFTPDAKINANAPENYQNLDRFEAREKVIQEMQDLNLLEKIEPHTLKIPRGDRSNAIIEPYLTNQWFIRMESLAKPAIEAVKSGKIKFIPENWENTYFQWLNNINDWCISRQLWWGHRIPAFYDADNNIYIGESEESIRKQYNLDKNILLTQDSDVLDTWFSSALWPFSTLGWPDNTPELEKFYPTSVLITGFDIIFFWVARMIMFGLKFMEDIPFSEIYITGLIRDPEGQKMSKSKGNVIDPIDLVDGIDLENLIQKRIFGLMQPQMKNSIIEKTKKQFPDGIKAHGADALRLTFASLASTSRDICFDLGRLEGYRNFCNKLWNATRFVKMQLENNPFNDEKPQDAAMTLRRTRFASEVACGRDLVIAASFGDSSDHSQELTLADQWILSRLQQVIHAAHEHIKNYRFDLLINALYDFTWHEYCDWYLELVKILPNYSRSVLTFVLENILKLWHPIIPFITEKLWQSLDNNNNNNFSIMLEAYPEANLELINLKSEQDINWLRQIILSIRNIKSEMQIAPSKLINLLLSKGNNTDQENFILYKNILIKLAKLNSIEYLLENQSVPKSATAVVGDLSIFIPLENLINLDSEKARLAKEINKLEQEINKTQAKLNRPDFINKAPKEIIQKEQERLKLSTENLAKFKQQLAQL